MLNLFALTNDPATRRLRFSLSNEVQIELTELFRLQESSFNNNGQEEIPFDGKYKPDPGEVLVIQDFDDIDGLADAVANPLSIAEVMPTPQVFGAIKALFSGYIDDQGNAVVFIQFFDKKRVISTNGLSIFHSASVYKKIEGIGLTIDERLTGVIKGRSLRFHSFHHLRQIFDLSDYYKEATDVDIQQFAARENLIVKNTANLIANSDGWVRRKLWLISQSQILDVIPVSDIKAVAAEFSIHLNTEVDDGVEKITIPESKKDLKTLLRFLDEDYYKSPLLHNQYLTNSKRPI